VDVSKRHSPLNLKKPPYRRGGVKWEGGCQNQKEKRQFNKKKKESVECFEKKEKETKIKRLIIHVHACTRAYVIDCVIVRVKVQV
jgi:hypothetical protein